MSPRMEKSLRSSQRLSVGPKQRRQPVSGGKERLGMDEARQREQAASPPGTEARERWARSGSGRPNGKIRILIVDDHAVLRQALRLLIEIHDDVEVVGD